MRRYVTPPLTPAHVFLGRIPKGYPGTQRTVEYIKALIRAGAKDFYVRQKAIDILLEKGVAPKDYRGEIKAVFEWVQHNVRYTKDPFRVEVLHSARRLLELRAGDCDDMSILLGSMLEAIGHPIRLVLTGPDPLRPRLFSHIYLEVFHKGCWIALDATMPYPMGWAPRAMVKRIFAMERGRNMVAGDLELQGVGAAAAVPDWLKGLIRTVRSGAIQPQDTRVKSLWDLLKQRRLLDQSPWLKAVLQRVWSRGLSARPHPRTARRIVNRLQLWGIWPPRSVSAAPPRPATTRPLAPVPVQPVRPVAVKPVGSVKPVNMQSIRPVQMPSGTLTGARK